MLKIVLGGKKSLFALCAAIFLLLCWLYMHKHEEIKTYIQTYTVRTKNLIQEPLKKIQKLVQFFYKNNQVKANWILPWLGSGQVSCDNLHVFGSCWRKHILFYSIIDGRRKPPDVHRRQNVNPTVLFPNGVVWSRNRLGIHYTYAIQTVLTSLAPLLLEGTYATIQGNQSYCPPPPSNVTRR